MTAHMNREVDVEVTADFSSFRSSMARATKDAKDSVVGLAVRALFPREQSVIPDAQVERFLARLNGDHELSRADR